MTDQKSLLDSGHTPKENIMLSFDMNVQCEEEFRMMRLVFSDCCGEYMSLEHEEIELCPHCGEHCVPVIEEIEVSREVCG